MHCPACGKAMRRIELEERADDPDADKANYSYSFICDFDSTLSGFVSGSVKTNKGIRIVSFMRDPETKPIRKN